MTTEQNAARDLSAKFRVSAAAGRAEVIAAVEATRGNATRAAKLLGVSHRTMLRLMKDPVVAESVARVRAAARVK